MNIKLKSLKKIKKKNQLLKARILSFKGRYIEILWKTEVDKLKQIETINETQSSKSIRVIKNGEDCVLKILKSNIDKAQFGKLIYMINEQQNPYIAQVIGIFYGDENNSPSILSHFYPHNLKDIVMKMNPIQKVCCIYEICLSMEMIHKKGLIHRRLRPWKILFDENGHVVINDLFASRVMDNSLLFEPHLNRDDILFMAPEVLLGKDICYDKTIDVYSFGYILYYILNDSMLPEFRIKYISNYIIINFPPTFNEISRNLISRCLSYKKQRPSFNEIIKYIEENNFNLNDGIENSITEIKDFLLN